MAAAAATRQRSARAPADTPIRNGMRSGFPGSSPEQSRLCAAGFPAESVCRNVRAPLRHALAGAGALAADPVRQARVAAVFPAESVSREVRAPACARRGTRGWRIPCRMHRPLQNPQLNLPPRKPAQALLQKRSAPPWEGCNGSSGRAVPAIGARPRRPANPHGLRSGFPGRSPEQNRRSTAGFPAESVPRKGRPSLVAGPLRNSQLNRFPGKCAPRCGMRSQAHARWRRLPCSRRGWLRYAQLYWFPGNSRSGMRSQGHARVANPLQYAPAAAESPGESAAPKTGPGVASRTQCAALGGLQWQQRPRRVSDRRAPPPTRQSATGCEAASPEGRPSRVADPLRDSQLNRFPGKVAPA
eukprot:gene19304-biopygen29597